jgi:hypothetical protein
VRAVLAAFLFFYFVSTIFAQSLFPPLQTDNLSKGSLMRNIYLGRFERIPAVDSDKTTQISDEGYAGRKALLAYVAAFSDQCPTSLSSHKLEIKEILVSYSERQEIWMTRYGPIYGATSREVTGSEARSTGIFAEPEFYQAYNDIYTSATVDGFAEILRNLAAKRSDSLAGASFNLLRDILEWNVQTRALIVRHGCTSAQTQTYAKNLLKYARGQNAAIREETFLVRCREKIAVFFPGKTPESCSCLESTFRNHLGGRQYGELEDDFTEDRFLTSAFSKVGMHSELSRCLQ